MKFNATLFALLGATLLLCSCEEEKFSETFEYESGNMPSSVKVTTDYAGIKSLTLFQLDDYDFNQMVKDNPAQGAAACSEVRVGNTVVRNLDWFQYDQATYVVSLPETDKHLGSLQVCGTSDLVPHKYNNENPDPKFANLLLAATNDGMNTAGVYIGVNVVPYGQMSTDGSKGNVNNTPIPNSPYARCKRLMTSYVTRMVLDHARSLKEAEEIIKAVPWKDTPILVEAGFQAHWLVCTEEGSFVCEFINGEPTFTYSDSEGPNYGNIMTNFSNYLMANGGHVQTHGAGYERFKVLADNYSTATPRELAKLVFYTKMYTVDYTKPDYFWTEYATDHYPAQLLMTWRDDTTTRKGAIWNEFVQEYEHNNTTWNPEEWGYDYDKSRGAWYTAHSSIWDIHTRTLTLDIEEKDVFGATFELDALVW